jgi:mono/diheme cytochrome c family protein
MLDETPAQLVAHLSHPNGWWRDTAQQLLVLRQDRSVVPALQRIVRMSKPSPADRRRFSGGASPTEARGGGGNLLARFHALWTLEGLGALDAALIREVLRDPVPRMRIQALRASETLYKAGDRSFADDYRRMSSDPDTDVAIQAMLTLQLLKVADAQAIVKELMEKNKARGVQFVGDRILATAAAAERNAIRGGALTSDQLSSIQRGGTVYAELCFACHGADGRGTPTPGGGPGSTLAPSLAGSPRVNAHRDYAIKAVMHGLTGPIDGRTYPQVMVPMGSNTDQWIADVASYVRNSFGNSGPLASTADIARVRATTGTRGPWTIPELEASLPHALATDSSWKVTASHDGRPAPQANAEGGYNYLSTAAGALTFLGWTTGVPQQPGMWLQIELPAFVTLMEIQFTSSRTGGQSAGATWTFPRHYEVRVSNDGSTWSEPVVEGEGTPGTTVVAFAPVRTKFVRITQTGTVDANAPPWTMRMLRLYEAPANASAVK